MHKPAVFNPGTLGFAYNSQKARLMADKGPSLCCKLLNATSVYSKVSAVHNLIRDEAPSRVCVTETWLEDAPGLVLV